MKKTAWIALALSAVMLFTACGNESAYETEDDDTDKKQTTKSTATTQTTEDTQATEETRSATEETTGAVISKPGDEQAIACLEGFFTAQTEDEMKSFMTEDCQDQAKDLLGRYPQSQPIVNVIHKAKYKQYDVYYYELTYSDVDGIEVGYTLLYPDGEQYKICNNQEILVAMAEAYSCTTCGGTGTLITGAPVVCGICGGTGTWYNPSAYYDPTLNMWMGQYTGCGNCGGSGQLAGSNTSTCTGCGGQGLTFP